MSKYRTREVTEEDAKEIAKEGCATFIFSIAWFFCIPFILSQIWNGIIAVKFGLDINFSYAEMFGVWMFFQFFTDRFKIELPFVKKIKFMGLKEED